MWRDYLQWKFLKTFVFRGFETLGRGSATIVLLFLWVMQHPRSGIRHVRRRSPNRYKTDRHCFRAEAPEDRDDCGLGRADAIFAG